MNDAERCFTENLRLIGRGLGGVPTDPQAWNLNHGLLLLTRQVASLQEDVQQLRSELRAVRTELQNARYTR